MSAANLVNLNVETLFEQHGVAEIDIVHKKIQEVVEQKREELRTMVGERYRDLLQAADTIAAMQSSSQTLIDQVDCIRTNCRSLNEQQLIGFKTNEATSIEMLRQRSANKQLNNYFSTMVQIKLLTALPELIWSHIDRQHFYAATELFTLSRHISTGLQLDVNNKLMQHLPVAKKQWEILKPFHVTIKQSVLAALQREELSLTVTVDCLLSLLLLEKSNLNEVLKTFLKLRSAGFLECLTRHGKREESERRRVKDTILASLKILNGTIDLLEKCFLNDGPILQKLAPTNAEVFPPPTISLMDSNDTQFAHLLPEIISSFRPKFDQQKLEKSQILSGLTEWLGDTQKTASVQLKQLFELVASMQTMQEIKLAALKQRENANLENYASKLGVETTMLDFYVLQYAPCINQRVRNIIQGSWVQAMQKTFEALEAELPNAHNQKSQLWCEQASDLPNSLEVALSENLKIKKLLMKTKGNDDVILAICETFDSELASIIDEMNILLEEQHSSSNDKLALVDFLRETATTQLTDFIGKLRSLQLRSDHRAQLLFVVRFSVALVELCPHLKICFCQQGSWRQWFSNAVTNNLEHWQRICLLLEEEIYSFWLQIIDGVLAEHNAAQHLPLAMTHDVILSDFAHWQSITLDQKDEQQNTVTSSFRIPNQPRISLQLYLFALIRTLNETVPQTLPPKVLQACNHKLLTHYLLAHYQTLSTHETTTSSQNVALQLYFDLKFLHNIFGVPREERTLNEQFQLLQNTLKDCIDPFDFELFAEQITTNVKQAVQRLHCEFGVLTTNTKLKAAKTTAASSTLVHEKDPNVLSLSTCGSTSLWFPLLPIVAGNVSNKARDKSKMMRAAITTSEIEKPSTPTRSKTTATRKGDASKNKSGAASFFGAMSQEWFR